MGAPIRPLVAETKTSSLCHISAVSHPREVLVEADPREGGQRREVDTYDEGSVEGRVEGRGWRRWRDTGRDGARWHQRRGARPSRGRWRRRWRTRCRCRGWRRRTSSRPARRGRIRPPKGEIRSVRQWDTRSSHGRRGTRTRGTHGALHTRLLCAFSGKGITTDLRELDRLMKVNQPATHHWVNSPHHPREHRPPPRRSRARSRRTGSRRGSS